MFFRLHPYCVYEQDESGGCIYNLFTGEIWDIDRLYQQAIFEGFEGRVSTVEANKCLEELIRYGVGMYFSTSVYSQTIDPGESVLSDISLPPLLRIANLHLVLTGKCNAGCGFCNKDMIRMTGCKYHSQSTLLDFEQYRDLISQISYLGCRTIRFSGGDPLLVFDLLTRLVEYAETLGIFNFEIMTNGLMLDRQMLSFISIHNITVTLQVGMLDDRTLKIVGKLVDEDIKCKICLIISSQNCKTVKPFSEAIRKKMKAIRYDFIFNDKEMFTSPEVREMYDDATGLRRVTTDMFGTLKKRSECLSSQVAIMPNGDVTPCPMMDEVVLFNGISSGFVEGLKNPNYGDIIRLSKNRIKTCKACRYRFGCPDCRAVAWAITGEIDANGFCMRKPQ